MFHGGAPPKCLYNFAIDLDLKMPSLQPYVGLNRLHLIQVLR